MSETNSRDSSARTHSTALLNISGNCNNNNDDIGSVNPFLLMNDVDSKSSTASAVASSTTSTLTSLPQKSNLLERLNAFLPVMAAANESLETALASGVAPETYNVEAIEEGDRHILMDVTLGEMDNDNISDDDDEHEDITMDLNHIADVVYPSIINSDDDDDDKKQTPVIEVLSTEGVYTTEDIPIDEEEASKH